MTPQDDDVNCPEKLCHIGYDSLTSGLLKVSLFCFQQDCPFDLFLCQCWFVTFSDCLDSRFVHTHYDSRSWLSANYCVYLQVSVILQTGP